LQNDKHQNGTSSKELSGSTRSLLAVVGNADETRDSAKSLFYGLGKIFPF